MLFKVFELAILKFRGFEIFTKDICIDVFSFKDNHL